MKNNLFKILIVGFLVIIGGLIVIASDVIVKQGDLTINKLTATNVGIGIANPSEILDINGNVIISNSQTTGNANKLRIRGSTNGNVVIEQTSNSGGIYIRTNSGASADIAGNLILNDNGGNVGIGISTPGAKLHVVGTVRLASVGFGTVGVKDYVCIDSAGTLSRSDTPCA